MYPNRFQYSLCILIQQDLQLIIARCLDKYMKQCNVIFIVFLVLPLWNIHDLCFSCIKGHISKIANVSDERAVPPD